MSLWTNERQNNKLDLDSGIIKPKTPISSSGVKYSDITLLRGVRNKVIKSLELKYRLTIGPSVSGLNEAVKRTITFELCNYTQKGQVVSFFFEEKLIISLIFINELAFLL